jgi:hypothetical protein
MLRRATLLNALIRTPTEKAVVKVIDLLPAKADMAISSNFTSQTAIAETVHRDVLVPANTIRLGGWLRWTILGTLTTGSSAVTFTVRLRWGGLTGTALIQMNQLIASGLTDRTWRMVFYVTVKGPLGTACEIDTWLDWNQDSTTTVTPVQSNIVNVDTTLDKHLVFTGAMDTNVGSPSFKPGAALLETF